MDIKAAIFDIDGTLVPHGTAYPSQETCDTIAQLRKKGVTIIIATGRALFNTKMALKNLSADYYVCANGNWVTDAKGRVLQESRMTTEEMYALVDYFEDFSLPLNFIFDDGYYAYVEPAEYRRYYQMLVPNADFLMDGENQTRHLQSMPFAASGVLSGEHVAAFAQKYAHLGLEFAAFAQDHYDIMRAKSDKAKALTALLETKGIAWNEVAVFGDSGNDLGMLQQAGLAVVMANGSQSAKEYADIIAPSAQDNGVAAVIRTHLL